MGYYTMGRNNEDADIYHLEKSIPNNLRKVFNIWREKISNLEERIERKIAEVNSIENYLEHRSKGSWENSNKALGPPRGKKISFSQKEKIKSFGKTDSFLFDYNINLEDKKRNTMYTSMVNDWLSYPNHKKKQFFNDRWRHSRYSGYWTDLLTETINILMEDKNIILWGRQGGHRKVYEKDIDHIKDILKEWNIQMRKYVS